VLDNVLDHAKEIDDLLAEARNRDAEVQRLAAGKQYAGDPDPYKPEDDEDEGEDADDRVGVAEDKP
jgi:ribosome-binding factor A